MYLQIKKANLVPDTYGHRIEITMVGLYDSTGKCIKRVKLDDKFVQDLLDTKIQPGLLHDYEQPNDQ